ncbi:hypothetical protein HpBT077_01650 [Helicobacter pylori]
MANESIQGESYQLKDILATELSAYYKIPTYQRPYQWTEENCEKLLDDLLSSYECYKESDYFCGSLVLIAIGIDSKTNATTYDVVDGQQRLSTFILLAKVLVTLYDKDLNENCKISRDFLEKSLGDTEGEKRKRLIFNTIGLNAKDDFQDALKFFDDLDASKGENSKSNDPSKGKNSYLKNAICLKNYLEKKEIADINDFIRWLYFKVIFIRTTCSNISMALRIFSVLNARGLPLHAIDVFKVELLKKLAKEKDQEQFVSRWNALRQKCSENESEFPKRKENKREKNAAETLFSWYLTYLNPVTSGKNMEERLADQFERLNKPPLEYLKSIEDFYSAYCDVLEMQDRHAHLLSYLASLNPVTSGKNMEERLADQFERLNKPPLEYLKSIEDFYSAYCDVLEMQDRHAHLLSYLASDFWRIILCTSILHNYSQSEIETLKKLLVKFYYQNWVAEQKELKKQTNCNIIKALKEKKSVEDIASIVKQYLDENKITQNFREKLKDDHLYEKHKKSSKNSWLRPILIGRRNQLKQKENF